MLVQIYFKTQTKYSYWLSTLEPWEVSAIMHSWPHSSRVLYTKNQHFEITLTSHSVCNQCVALNTLRRQCKTEDELQRANDLRNQHRKVFGDARIAIQDLKQQALMCPTDHLFCQIGQDIGIHLNVYIRVLHFFTFSPFILFCTCSIVRGSGG